MFLVDTALFFLTTQVCAALKLHGLAGWHTAPLVTASSVCLLQVETSGGRVRPAQPFRVTYVSSCNGTRTTS